MTCILEMHFVLGRSFFLCCYLSLCMINENLQSLQQVFAVKNEDVYRMFVHKRVFIVQMFVHKSVFFIQDLAATNKQDSIFLYSFASEDVMV